MAISTGAICKAYGLKRFFSLNESEIGRASPELRLHYLILYQKVQAEAGWIEKYSAYVDAKEPESLLTPLHLCAILGDEETAQALLRHPRVSIAEQDMRKWTPLHHAALREDPKMLELLQEVDKVKNSSAAVLRNQNNGTYQDLRRMAFPQEIHPNLEVFKYKNSTGAIVGGKPANFQEMTGARFARQMCASPAFFISEWKDPSKIATAEIENAELLKDDYQRYQQEGSLLYLGKSRVGNGVFAMSTIPVDTIVVDYLGESTPDRSNTLYRVHLCDGAKRRNLGPMINDGFPNCVDVPLANLFGYPLIRVLRTTCQVEQGEELLWNYGIDHPVKIDVYLSLARLQTEQWFIDRSLFNRYVDLLEILRNQEKKDMDLAYRKLMTYLNYLFTTPSYQILMLLKRKVIAKDLFSIIRHDFLIEKDRTLLNQLEIRCNLNTIKCIYDFCETQKNPREMEKNLVALVEELFASFRADVVQTFLWYIFKEKPYPPAVIAVMQGKIAYKEQVFAMVKDFQSDQRHAAREKILNSSTVSK